MVGEQQWFAAQPEYENWGSALASDTEAYSGHLSKARELTQRAVDSAIRADNKENGAIWLAIAAQREAAYGYPAEARKSAADALKLAPASQGVANEAALALAMAGDTAHAESLAHDLGKRFPLDTQTQSLWLPAIQAEVALERKTPAAALNTLQASLLHRVGANPVCRESFLPLSGVCARRVIFVSRAGWSRRRRVSENSRPQRDCLELLDGSDGTSGSGSGQCLAIENIARSGVRCGPRPGTRCLQRFPHPLERRRPRHSDPERSQSRVREATVEPPFSAKCN